MGRDCAVPLVTGGIGALLRVDDVDVAGVTKSAGAPVVFILERLESDSDGGIADEAGEGVAVGAAVERLRQPGLAVEIETGDEVRENLGRWREGMDRMTSPRGSGTP